MLLSQVTQHRKRCLSNLADHRKRFKKSERIKRQNEEWDKLEAEGGKVREWYKREKKKQKPNKAVSRPKKVPKKQSKRKSPSKKRS